MKKLLILIIIALPGMIRAQESVSLSDCYKAAREIHPLSGQKNLEMELWQLSDKNLSTGWYPSIDAGANIMYNTSVTDMNTIIGSLPIPGLPDDIGGMPHDQYKLTLDVNQLIWDGGAIKNSRVYEEKSRLINEQDIEIELYKIRENVNSVFFSLILLQRQEKLLTLYLELIDSKLKSTESAIENGLLLATARSSIAAEKIKLKQEIDGTNIKIIALCNLLSDLTGVEINPISKLLIPDPEISREKLLSRPELLALDLRIDKLEAGKALLQSSRMPKAFGFATLGYGNPPGSDFFSDEFGAYALVGAGLKWNIFDWNKSKRNKQKIDLSKTIISNRKSNIEDSFERALINKYAEIKSLKLTLESDKELIELRKSITLTSESQFNNGTITSTEYMTIMNLEKEAILSSTIHKVNYAKSRVEYLNISGEEIK